MHGHQGDHPFRAEAFRAVLANVDPGAADGDVAPGLDDLAPGEQRLAIRGGQQIHLEFHRENGGVRRHQGIGGVPGGIVGQSAHQPAMKEAVLLTQLGAVGHLDLAVAGGERRQAGPDILHESLPREAAPHPFLVPGVPHDQGDSAFVFRAFEFHAFVFRTAHGCFRF